MESCRQFLYAVAAAHIRCLADAVIVGAEAHEILSPHLYQVSDVSGHLLQPTGMGARKMCIRDSGLGDAGDRLFGTK